MKKIHTYFIEFYTSGGFLKNVFIQASTKAEAIKKVHEDYKVIETNCIKFIN